MVPMESIFFALIVWGAYMLSFNSSHFYGAISSTLKHLPFKDCLDDTDTNILRTSVFICCLVCD